MLGFGGSGVWAAVVEGFGFCCQGLGGQACKGLGVSSFRLKGFFRFRDLQSFGEG